MKARNEAAASRENDQVKEDERWMERTPAGSRREPRLCERGADPALLGAGRTFSTTVWSRAEGEIGTALVPQAEDTGRLFRRVN